MNKLRFVLIQIWKGSSVTRAYLNERLRHETLQGSVIDVGGGKNADYLSFMMQGSDVEFRTFDIKAGNKDIDFEKDKLPASDKSYETVLFLNVMEHIYNYQYIANEVVRITKPGGQLICFVPFLMWYHPDHSDYFRYTDEALEKIFKDTEISSIIIEEIGKGPFVAAAHMILLSFPRFLRIPIFLFFYIFDQMYWFTKRKNGRTYQLGYYFVITK